MRTEQEVAEIYNAAEVNEVHPITLQLVDPFGTVAAEFHWNDANYGLAHLMEAYDIRDITVPFVVQPSPAAWSVRLKV